MATKEVQYAVEKTGYNAMVSDFTEMFDWDAIEADENGSDFTIFKKSCGEKAYIGLRVAKSTSTPPSISAIAFNGVNTYTVTQRSSNATVNVAYAYGNGFFAFCASPSAFPNSSNPHWGGISTCRNILTGETGWCTFLEASYSGNTGIEPIDYYCLTKDTRELTSSSFTDWCLSRNAKIGSATSLHEPATGNVSDKILMLSAIPDSLIACVTPVIFNGTRYTRLGAMLVPAE